MDDATRVRAVRAAPGNFGRVPAATWVTWGVLGAAVFVLAWLMPPTSDDWRRLAFEHRTLAGYVEQAITSYAGHNGRIVGNSISFILIEPLWLRALVKALTVIGLVAGVQWVIDRLERPNAGRLSPQGVGSGFAPWLAWAVFAGVFLVPAGVFRESYVWSAGFFNYVPPLIGVILLVGTIAGRWPARRDSVLAGLLCGAIAFVAALFVEHVNVALVGVAFSGLVWVLVRRRRPTPALVGWLAGAVLGSLIMFGSPGLRDVVNHEDAYFSYPSTLAGAIDEAVVNYATISRSFLFSNPVLLLWLTALAVAVASARRAWGVVVTAVALLGYGLATRRLASDALLCAGDTMETCQRPALVIDLVALFLALGLIVWLGLHRTQDDDRLVLIGLLGATLLMLGPLLAVSPIGPRNLVGPTITLVALLALLSRDLLAEGGIGVRVARVGIVGVTVLGLVALLVIQVGNARVSAEREALMQQAVDAGADRVVLPLFPHPDWVHDARDPKIGNKYFKQTPRDIEIEFADG